MKTQDDKTLQYLQIKDARNSLNNAKQQLNSMTVVSPIDGVVTVRNNNNGDNIQSGKAVLVLIDQTSMKLKATVDELDISKVKIGQKVQVKFNAIQGKTFDGTVETISAVGTTVNNVTTYNTVIGLSDKTGVMLGMTANANIVIQSKTDALIISSEALINKGDKKYVMVPNESSDASKATAANGQKLGSNGTSSKDNSEGSRTGMRNGTQTGTAMQGTLVEVSVGIQNENQVEITQGIKEGQRVMILLPQSGSSTTSATSTKNENKSTGVFGLGGGMTGTGARGTSNR